MDIAFNAKKIEANRAWRGIAFSLLFLVCSIFTWWRYSEHIAFVFLLLSIIVASGFSILIWSSRRSPSILEVNENELTIPVSLKSNPRRIDLQKLTSWQIVDTKFSHMIIATNAHHVFDLRRGLFKAEDWQKVVTVFEKNAGPETSIPVPPIHPVWLLFVALLCLLHYFSSIAPDTADTAWIFEILGNGGASGALISTGDTWRLLSANLVHAHLPHLTINVLVTIYLGAQCGNRFTATDYIGLSVAVGLLAVLLIIQVPIVTLIVGASGITYGLFGFLLAAQISGDERLHPLHRVHSSRGLLLLLIAEFTMAALVTGYGAAIHIVSLIIGFCYYRLLVRPTIQSWHKVRLATHSAFIITALFLGFSFATERIAWLNGDRTEFALHLIEQPDSRLTTIGGLALLDQPNTTDAQVQRLLAQANRFPEKGQLLDLVKARALHWQGDSPRAHALMRNWIELDPRSTGAQNFFAALEREAAEANNNGLGVAINELPPGTGTAVLLTHTKDRMAFVSLTNDTQTIADRLPRHRFYSWYLLSIYPDVPFPKAAKLAHSWYLERTEYPTRASLLEEVGVQSPPSIGPPDPP